MSRKEKSAWVLDTPEADYQETNASSVPTAEKIINDEPKDYTTMLAQLRDVARPDPFAPRA
jgi:hypothetical protein